MPESTEKNVPLLVKAPQAAETLAISQTSRATRFLRFGVLGSGQQLHFVNRPCRSSRNSGRFPAYRFPHAVGTYPSRTRGVRPRPCHFVTAKCANPVKCWSIRTSRCPRRSEISFGFKNVDGGRSHLWRLP